VLVFARLRNILCLAICNPAQDRLQSFQFVFSKIVKLFVVSVNPTTLRMFKKTMASRAALKLHKMTYIIILATISITVSLLAAAPVFSLSSNQCSSFHGSTYNQQLDILESNSQNTIPTNIKMGQTQTVTVVISNINNAPRNNVFTSVTVTLGSQNGRFSVNSPSFNVGTLQTGTATATWQITGVSEGSDVLLISASATNTHENLKFQDSYSPGPSIYVAFDPNWTPTPTPVPTPLPSQTTTTPPSSTSNPAVINTPAPIQTPKPTPSPSHSTSSIAPTTQPSPNSTFSTPKLEQETETSKPTMSQNPLNSPLLYIHPPLAIIEYILIFAFAILVLKKKYVEVRTTKITGIALWLFTFLGLLTGMLWAQLALGSYWSWDPKEIMTLALFLSASVGQLFYFEKKYTATKWVALLTCALVILTGLSSFIIAWSSSFS
jgi:hypothetical protein